MNDSMMKALKLHKDLIEAIMKEQHNSKCIGWTPFDEHGWIACSVCNIDRQKPAPIMEWE
jgi:hypothetical protein